MAKLASAEELAARDKVIGGAAAIETNRRVLNSISKFDTDSRALAAQNGISVNEARQQLLAEERSRNPPVVMPDEPYVRPEDRKEAISTSAETNAGPTIVGPNSTAAVAPQSTKPTQPAGTTPSAETTPGQTSVNQDSRISTQGAASKQSFDINSFRSEIINNDVLPSHSYLVTFAPFRTGFPENAPLTDFVTNKRNTLIMRCENIVLPTPSLLEEENIRRYGYGPVEKIPYGVQFSDVSMTWLVDKRAEIIDFMHQWMNTIVMHDSPNANMLKSYDPENSRDGVFYSYNPFEVGYKDGYANPIVRIYVYNRQNQTVTEYEMYDVFPMNIQSMNLGWADENQVQKLTVNFAYTNMKVRAPQKTTATQMNSVMEMEMTTSFNEERKQPSNKGGKAAADKAASPIDEIVVTSVNSSTPFPYEAEPQTLNLGVPATLTLTTRELTSPS
jgi:hypothetical protein